MSRAWEDALARIRFLAPDDPQIGADVKVIWGYLGALEGCKMACEKIADFPSQHVANGEWQGLMLEAEYIASEALVDLKQAIHET